MGIFKDVVGFLKNEIRLNKEYYAELKEESRGPLQEEQLVAQPVVKPAVKSDVTFDPNIHVRTDTYTVYYAYGHVQKVFPPLPGGYYENRDIINAATFIVSDGVAYDLADENSIRSIKTPNYHIYAQNKIGEELGVTGCIDYVLRMRSGLYWGEGKFRLSIVCLEKATELMKYSTVGWSPKDFFRIVNELNDLGCFKRATEWEKWILENIPGAKATLSSPSDQISYHAREHFKRSVESCKYLETDLIETGDLNACCSICAMYRKRIFSLTGKDKRFPKFPKDYHWGCGLSGYPYIYGVSEPSFECENDIIYSNRPYIDDRTEEERQNYIDRMSKMEKEPPVIREPSLNRIIYYRLIQIIPDNAPKSLSGFSRMRNANSKNYQALVKKAEDAGFVFPKTLEDVKKWEE